MRWTKAAPCGCSRYLRSTLAGCASADDTGIGVAEQSGVYGENGVLVEAVGEVDGGLHSPDVAQE